MVVACLVTCSVTCLAIHRAYYRHPSRPVRLVWKQNRLLQCWVKETSKGIHSYGRKYSIVGAQIVFINITWRQNLIILRISYLSIISSHLNALNVFSPHYCQTRFVIILSFTTWATKLPFSFNFPK